MEKPHYIAYFPGLYINFTEIIKVHNYTEVWWDKFKLSLLNFSSNMFLLQEKQRWST